jgi:hypothetical protein
MKRVGDPHSPIRKHKTIKMVTDTERLPDDAWFHVFQFVDASTLHYTIPFVSRVFRNVLTQLWSTESRCDVRTSTNENLLWKLQFNAVGPEIPSTANDSLFNYHKMFFAKFNVKCPTFTHETKILDLQNKAIESANLLDSIASVSKNNNSGEFAANVKKCLKQFSTIHDELERKLTTTTQKTGPKTQEYQITSHFHGHGPFINATKAATNNDKGNRKAKGWHDMFQIRSLTIYSPVNGYSAKFVARIKQRQNNDERRFGDHDDWQNIHVALYDLSSKKEHYMIFIDVDNSEQQDTFVVLWRVLCFLQLVDDNGLAESRVTIVREFWNDIIKHDLIEHNTFLGTESLQCDLQVSGEYNEGPLEYLKYDESVNHEMGTVEHIRVAFGYGGFKKDVEDEMQDDE